jgi:hypothetical protein
MKQGKKNSVARFLAFKIYVLLVETKLNKVTLETEVNVSV